jgi:hypothetical protein
LLVLLESLLVTYKALLSCLASHDGVLVEFDGCLLRGDQEEMPEQHSTYCYSYGATDDHRELHRPSPDVGNSQARGQTSVFRGEASDSRDIDAAERHVQEKEYKVLVVVVADAVGHPRAMVIHPEHAAVAYSAVVRTIRLDRFTPLAVVPLLVFGHLTDIDRALRERRR